MKIRFFRDVALAFAREILPPFDVRVRGWRRDRRRRCGRGCGFVWSVSERVVDGDGFGV